LDLSKPQSLRSFLDRYGLSAKKGLGQHFLCSSAVLGSIQRALDGIQSALEIGPGPGVLTGMLCETCEHVAAIELDTRMIEALKESAPCAVVFNEDALEADLRQRLEAMPAPRAVVSNLPYYITGPLVTRIAEVKSSYSVAILMMQKEVAQRILAPAGNSDRGSLSVFLQLQFEIRKVADAPAGAFLPPPKVDSTVLSFHPKANAWPPELEDRLFKMVRSGFKQPRKTLENNLVSGGFGDRETVQAWIASVGLDARVRPQALANADWIQLANASRA
jgi:16S rRNA (adenine1518-N6/adenine1519-N6)-dimethyltransferase